MPLDPKQLEEWQRLSAELGRILQPAFVAAPNAPGADLTLGELRKKAAEVSLWLAPAVPALIAEVEQLRVLLRELEWPGDCGDCYFCDGHAPSEGEVAGTVVPSDDGRPWRVGHAPDCRLAAFL
jgi:hypothetical protein